METQVQWKWGMSTSQKLNIRKLPRLTAPRWNNVWPINRIALVKQVVSTPDWFETSYRGEVAYVSAQFITTLPDPVPLDIQARIERIGAAEIGRKRSVYFNGYNGMWCHRFADWLVMHAGLPRLYVPNTANCGKGIVWFVNDPNSGGFYFKQSCHKERMTGRYHQIAHVGKTLTDEEEQYQPTTGDYVYFRWKGAPSQTCVSHVGIVRSVNGTTFNTFEGNAGNKVASHEYHIDDKRIVGFGKPQYYQSV